MNAKLMITVLLLVLILASGIYLAVHRSRDHRDGETGAGYESPETETSRGDSPAMSAEDKVIVYYFYTTKRCPTCRKFEQYLTEMMKTDFSRQIDSGTLEFLLVNVDVGTNDHFIDDYELTTKAVIVSEYRDGEQVRWKNLDRIWSVVGDKQEFMDYVRDGIEDYLGG
jgi:hypothetical protein